MSSVRNGNTIYIDDSSDTFAITGLKVSHIIVTATGSNGQAVLADLDTNAVKADLRVATSGTSQTFRFADQPMVFPTGVQLTTLTNAVVTLITSVTNG